MTKLSFSSETLLYSLLHAFKGHKGQTIRYTGHGSRYKARVKGAVRRVAHAHYDTYVIMKPDSRPDGTAIRDHARVRVLQAIHARAQCSAVLDAIAMAEAMDDAVHVAAIEEAPQTVSPSEILPAASRCSSLSVVPCRISTRP